MSKGVLWFSDALLVTEKHPEVKIDDLRLLIKSSLLEYGHATGQLADLVLVHYRALEGLDPEKLREIADEFAIALRPWRYMLPGHLWVGRDDAPVSIREHEHEKEVLVT